MPIILLIILLIVVLGWGFWKIVFAGLIIAALGPFAFAFGIVLLCIIVGGIVTLMGKK